jgi:hypothetical protein
LHTWLAIFEIGDHINLVMMNAHPPLQATLTLHNHKSFIVAASSSNTHCWKWQWLEVALFTIVANNGKKVLCLVGKTSIIHENNGI